MKVLVDRNKCNNCGLCQKHAPEVFKLGPDGRLVLLQEELEESLGRKVKLAAFFCPRNAIAAES